MWNALIGKFICLWTASFFRFLVSFWIHMFLYQVSCSWWEIVNLKLLNTTHDSDESYHSILDWTGLGFLGGCMTGHDFFWELHDSNMAFSEKWEIAWLGHGFLGCCMTGHGFFWKMHDSNMAFSRKWEVTWLGYGFFFFLRIAWLGIALSGDWKVAWLGHYFFFFFFFLGIA